MLVYERGCRATLTEEFAILLAGVTSLGTCSIVL